MLIKLYLWFISLYERDHSTKTNEEVQPLGLNLQFFAEEDDEGDDDVDEGDDDNSDDDDVEDDSLDLDELLKDPEFKKQYNKRFKKQLGKRMKKYEGIDPEEYRRLKEQAGKKKDKKDNEDDDEVETLRDELNQKEKKLLRAERREKRAMVKEYAVDNQVNPKLLSRLINVDDIELDEDGEADNLDDLFEELEEEFPEYFGVTDDEDDEEEFEIRKKKRRSSYVPGARKKGNKKKKVDPKEAGRQKALERHKKEDE